MKKIISIIRPYMLEQTLMVYEDGNKIDIKKTTMEDFNSAVFELMAKHQTCRVDLAAAKKYAEGIKLQLQEDKENLSKYQFNELEINIV